MGCESVKVDGWTFRVAEDSKLMKADIKKGDTVLLVPEPTNKYDDKAIAVIWKDKKIGYLPNNSTRDNFKGEAEIKIKEVLKTKTDTHLGYPKIPFSAGSITRIILEGVSEKHTSFNENLTIMFNVEKHKYMCNGKELTGTTTLLKEFSNEFDIDKMTAICAKSWSMGDEKSKKILKEALPKKWRSNAPSKFGTAIHEYLEDYFNYQ